MKKRIIPLIVLLIVLAIAAVAWFRRDNLDENRFARLSGNLELTEVNIAFKMPGKIADLSVREGDAVKKGQVIGRLDSDSLERQREREQAGVTIAQTQLTQLRTAIEYQSTALQRERDMRRAEIAQAQAQLRDLESGSREQEKLQARAALDEIQAQYDQAARDWDRAQRLFRNDDISAQQYEQFRTRHAQSKQALAQAAQRLSLIEEGPRKESIALARAQLSRAQAASRLTDAQEIEIRRREQELATRQAEIERAQAQLKVLDSQLNDTVAVSPVDGVVLTKTVEAGEVVSAGTVVLTIGDIEHPWLRGYITQRQLGRVKIGDKARLKTDSYPDRTYEGTVTFVSAEAEFTPKQIQTPEERVKLVYRVKIEVPNQHRELKSNMPVDGLIELSGK
jgi:HlyD family secretion protein